jgi:hypothetical protein
MWIVNEVTRVIRPIPQIHLICILSGSARGSGVSGLRSAKFVTYNFEQG